jgi:uncharacterized membrane protein
MTNDRFHAAPRITAKIAGRPLHPLLRPFAVGYFLAVLGCDLLYANAGVNARFSAQGFGSVTEWLLGAGLVSAVLCGVVALVDMIGERRFRDLPDLGLYIAGGALVLAIELYNFTLRQAGGNDAIVPMGLILSLSAVAVLLATPSRNWSRMYRQAR